MPLTGASTVPLGHGVDMPLLGFGMSHNGGDCSDALVAALQNGCRLLDTAARYGTEGLIPRAVQAAGMPYSDVFVTTKLWVDEIADPVEAAKRSLQRLERDDMDLYLMHWPGVHAGRSKRAADAERAEVWRGLERVREAGLSKAIGVSNFLERHLAPLLDEGEISCPPALNQIEVNPWQNPAELMAYCADHGIQIEGYAPLAKGNKVTSQLKSPELLRVCAEHKHADGSAVTPAQCLIRWALQKNVVTIPMTSNVGRAKENREVFDFELSESAMREMDGWHEDLHVTWTPTHVT